MRRGGEGVARRVGPGLEQDVAGLDADVGRARLVPVAEVAGDGGQAVGAVQVNARRSDVEDAPRHRRVVGPLAGAKPPRPPPIICGPSGPIGAEPNS